MADERMKAVVEEDEVEDGDGEVGLQEMVERDEEDDELELSLSLVNQGWNVGFTSDWPAMDTSIWSEQGAGSSLDVKRSGRVRQLDTGEGTKDWGDVGDSREGLMETEPLPHISPLFDADYLDMKMGTIFGREKDTQHKRPKVVSNQHEVPTSSANPIVPAEIIDFMTLSSSYQPAEMKGQTSNVQSDDGTNKPDGGAIYGDNIGARNAEDIEFRMDLSDDLLHLVFSFLGQKDLCRAGSTCRQWLIASANENFWRCLKFENTRISLQNFIAICDRYPNATEVNMIGTPNADALVNIAMNSLRRLEILILDKGHFSDGFFHTLTDCPALTSLKISDASIGNGIQEITVYHENLHELQMIKCRVLRVIVRCPQLQTLSLKRSSMAHALLTCPQLHLLDLSSCHKLSDTAIRTAAMSCPLLASLDMSSCSCVTDETIREIASTCPNLCILDASNCPNISLESVKLPKLMDLRLESCEGIISASITAISYSQMLESLKLDNCSMLTAMTLDMPNLQSISLVHLRKFVYLDLRSPVLKQIKISRCSALQDISIISNVLQKLVLQKQESLAYLSLQCQSLLELDLSNCDSLTDSLEVFNNEGGCPKLRSLILDNCQSLSIIDIKSYTLVSLSLDGCRAITTLELSCPNLQKLNLDGCDHLEKASFCPVGLESLDLGICPRLCVLRIEAPKMLRLELKGCGVLSEAYINCPCLESLDASFCSKLSDESLYRTAGSCPQIRSLVLTSCLSVGPNGLSSLHMLQHLALLDLSYTFVTNLQPVFDNCFKLETLRLSACKYLTDSSLGALYKESALPDLRELDLSYSSAGQLDILDILIYCTNLAHLNLNGCANIHQLVWSNLSQKFVNFCSPSILKDSDKDVYLKNGRLLQILNCTGCPNITKAHISSSANCFYLSKINLNLSINLKEVDLACGSLCILNLSYCNSLEFLMLKCPRLNNLQLLACSMLAEEQLEAAISQCPTLEIMNIDFCPKIHSKDFYKWHAICPSLKRIQSCS
ncbi:F-box/LRR-repeat protein 15-like isoform X1 [Zingiber officinale]|nr:F-box/LRR-repeat protein 15-like isoform X1 [Zingiber officinale]XP_042473018.1 F-box/LRR-repeat protein 15-like isoform X1 [Zingiber officinale]XP_042473020.1 F-box/LRR-repeat protein 15-like isoform X1 [Zingiber officinale]